MYKRQIWICETCAVETADLAEPPPECLVCEDERQWVPPDGQRWTTLAQLRARGTRIVAAEVEPDLWGLRADPEVGIGQQTMVVRTPQGTLLFDCVGYLDDEALDLVRSLGPTLAVAASHPHMYGVQTEWAHALGDVPVLVAERDRDWVRRPSPLVELTAVLAHEVVERPGRHGRLAQGGDRLGEVGVARGAGLPGELGAQGRELARRGGIQLLDGGTQVQDHACILPHDPASRGGAGRPPRARVVP